MRLILALALILTTSVARALDWRYPAGALGIVAASSLLDEPIRDYMQEHRAQSGHRLWAKGSDYPLYSETPLFLSAAFMAGALYTKDEREKRVAMTIPLAFVMTNGVTRILKIGVGRERPYSSPEHPYVFHGNSYQGNNSSFPSGHTAPTFAMAAAIAQNYDTLWVDVPAYGYAAFVGYSRLYDGAHWFSDVVGGAFLGIGIARGVDYLYRRPPSDWALLPATNGLYIQHRFG